VASYAFSVDFYMWTWFVVDSVGSGWNDCTPLCFQRRISTCEPGVLRILSGQDELAVCTTYYLFGVGGIHNMLSA
jgi:hypothetical protein